jgi:hypothetical protein
MINRWEYIMIETKYVIILHNRDDFSFEESPLLDEYPKPELIEYYLRRSNYRYAKVEKRYALHFEEGGAGMEEKQMWKIRFVNEYGAETVIYCHSEQEVQARRKELDEQKISYEVTIL